MRVESVLGIRKNEENENVKNTKKRKIHRN